MKSSRFFGFYIIAIATAAVSYAMLQLITKTNNSPVFRDQYEYIVVIIISLLSISITILIELRKSRDNLSVKQFNVSIIGFPQSGKTTLIVSLFQEIFKQKIIGIKATLKGESTINRINHLIERKESGLPVGPTTDQSMFAYRTEIEIGKGPFRDELRVEFGDFPGEFSEKINDKKYFDFLKKSEFFKWSIEANAYVFIIDVGKYLLERNTPSFIATTSRMIRESLQHFLEYSVRVDKFKKKPVLLIFNKMDLCNYSLEKSNRDEILRFAFSTTSVPKIKEVEISKYEKLKENLLGDFHDLIVFIKSECKQFNILFTSSFGTIDNKLADVQKVLKFILPRDIISDKFTLLGMIKSRLSGE